MELQRRTAKSLVVKLRSVSEQTRYDALYELRMLTKHDPDSRLFIAESGAITYLSETLYSASPEAQENAAAALLNLSITAKEPIMATRGLLDALSHILSRHNSTSTPNDAVQSAAAVIHSLLIVDAYRPIIGAKRDIIYALIDIIRTPSSPARSIKDALKALFGISLHPLNRPSVIQLGAVTPLFGLILKDGRVGIVEDATAVIAQIAGCEESEEVFRNVSGINVLVDLLDVSTGSSLRIKENAVSALLNLARCSGQRVVEDVKVIGVSAMDGISGVADNGTHKGKTKAAELLGLIGATDVSISRDLFQRFDYLHHRSS